MTFLSVLGELSGEQCLNLLPRHDRSLNDPISAYSLVLSKLDSHAGLPSFFNGHS